MFLESLRSAARDSRFGSWMLDRALRLHSAHPCRHHLGPARVCLVGWVYFRVLCGIYRHDGQRFGS